MDLQSEVMFAADVCVLNLLWLQRHQRTVCSFFLLYPGQLQIADGLYGEPWTTSKTSRSNNNVPLTQTICKKISSIPCGFPKLHLFPRYSPHICGYFCIQPNNQLSTNQFGIWLDVHFPPPTSCTVVPNEIHVCKVVKAIQPLQAW